jgi:8-oxo-dGTP diphosphatase
MQVPTFGKPQHGLTYTDRPGAYAVLRNEKGEIAIVKTGFGAFLPGGGSDDGESLEQTLHREVFEEIGFRLSNIKKIGEARQYVISNFYNKNFCKHGHFYTADWTKDPAASNQKDHSLVWAAPEKAAEILSHEFQRWIVREMLKK